MKKKVFRERYAIKSIETFTEKIEEPESVKVVKEEPKKRGKKSVKSDK